MVVPPVRPVVAPLPLVRPVVAPLPLVPVVVPAVVLPVLDVPPPHCEEHCEVHAVLQMHAMNALSSFTAVWPAVVSHCWAAVWVVAVERQLLRVMQA